jgi:type I restriction enzyme S subunit
MLRTDEQVFLGQRLVLYRADPQVCDRRFLLYAMLGPDVQSELRRLGSGATVEHLRVPDCESLPIPCPSLPTQRRIGSILGALDDLTANNRWRIELLEQMVQAIYREWFVNFRYPGYESLDLVESAVGPIPEGWEVTTIGQVLDLRYGKALKEADRNGGPVAVVGSSDVVGWHDAAMVPGPAIVVGRKGNVGNVMWVPGPCWPIDTTYYVHTDLSLRYVAEQLKRAQFINSHAAVPGLSRDQAYSLPFLLPAPEIMLAFAGIAETLGQQQQLLTEQTKRLAAIRDLLLPKLVTGLIDVSSLDLDNAVVESVA